jgi:hypothetical protein
MSYPMNIEKFANKVIVWDETVPKEESAGLFISPTVNVTAYNGISVDWKNYSAVYLPPGKATLTVNLLYSPWSPVINKKDVPFEWTFQTGDRYTLTYSTEWGVSPVIKLQNMNEKTALKDQPSYYVGRPPKTVLEPPANDHVSPEGSAVLVFGEGVIVWAYNGTNVYDEFYPDRLWKLHKVTVPAGRTSIQFDYIFNLYRSNLTIREYGLNIELNYNFEAGKEYTLAAYSKRVDLFTIEYGLNIWDFASTSGKPGAAQNSHIIKSWKFGEDKPGDH